MRKRRAGWAKKAGITLLAVAILGVPTPAQAAQPHSSYWYPDTLLEWSPAADPDAAFNRGTVKLQNGRFIGERVNPHARPEAKVIALSSMYPSTSGAPSQGSDQFHTYTFGFWQYIDKLVMWGGSAGEGLIVPPSADVIDAAHKNGVPVYGTVFLPQTEHGGKIEWMRDLLRQREDGTFPVADKLIEVARYYGFDGWFINQETQGGTPEDARNMQSFLTYLQRIKDPGMEIIWYDSMIDEGRIGWQGALTGKNEMFFQDGKNRVSDAMFLDFRWQRQNHASGNHGERSAYQSSPAKAAELGRSPYDLYAGIDVEARGYEGTYNWPVLFPDGAKAVTSLGIYRPDWAFNGAGDHEQYLEREERFWVGMDNTPAASAGKPAGAAWDGIAHFIVDKSVIAGPEFITHFNTGNGHRFAVNGKPVREQDWSNRSLQDILPTWRWITESIGSGKTLQPSFDFSTSFYGGSSLKVAGTLEQDTATHVKLYKTAIPLEAATELSVIYQADGNAGRIEIGAAFSDQPDKVIFFQPTRLTAVSEDGTWKKGTVRLKKYKGRTISSLSLKFSADTTIAEYRVNIGQLAVTRKQEPGKPLRPVHGLKVTDNDFRDGIYGDTRLAWEAPKQEEAVLHYEIYRVRPDGRRELMGVTGNTVYYVPEMKRLEKESETKLEVIPVNRRYERGKSAFVNFAWPSYPKPVAAFEADHTLIAPGGRVRFTDRSSEVTESWAWSFPGGEPSSSTDRNPQVTYSQEGTYEVILRAANEVGEDVAKRQYITVTREAAGGVTDLARGKEATASSYVNEKEAPPFALDGDDKTKWCAVGEPPHTLTVDFGAARKVSQFIVKHAEAGGEPAAFNTRSFRIRLSLDGTNWTDAVEVADNKSGVSKHAITLTEARYARLIVEKPTQGGDTAARIYGFEVMGLE
ncbi:MULTISPECIES: endo-beta-N-acetylglucosaminidase [Paenibacillus]|uniref:endo-beta-N-acetylglucosaminidase n=1 Tax=Paenibacillus TaxID=44249 RepID=UPI002FE297FB